MQDIDTHVAQTAARGEIALQHCPACDHVQAVARPFCLVCLGDAPVWRLAEGRGRVVAHTVQHRAPFPEWHARIPYGVALVDLAEGPRVMALAAPGLAPGDAVRLVPGGRHALPFFDLWSSHEPCYPS